MNSHEQTLEKHHRPLLRWIGALSISAATACSGADSTELSGGTATGSSEVATPASDSTHSEDGLTIATNTNDLLAGWFTGTEQPISFELRRDADRFAAAIYDNEDALVLRLTTSPERESLELQNELRLDGPSGSLFTLQGPEWSKVSVQGDRRQLTGLAGSSALSRFAELTAVLTARTDIDPELFPSAHPFHEMQQTPAPVGEIGVVRQYSATECVACNLACSAATLACTLPQGGPGNWVAWLNCAPANIACHAACIAGACK